MWVIINITIKCKDTTCQYLKNSIWCRLYIFRADIPLPDISLLYATCKKKVNYVCAVTSLKKRSLYSVSYYIFDAFPQCYFPWTVFNHYRSYDNSLLLLVQCQLLSDEDAQGSIFVVTYNKWNELNVNCVLQLNVLSCLGRQLFFCYK